MLVKLAHKICTVHALTSLHFREASFRAANAAAQIPANSIKFKQLARVKFVNLILPKPPFKLGFVRTGSVCVVAYHAVNVEDASAASERLCALKHLVRIRAL